jgi:hypothetical protein
MVCGIYVWVSGGNSTGAQKDHLLDIGVDPAGGTSYTALISNILCGQSGNAVDGGRKYWFPIRIPSGASVAARIQGNNATAGTVRVGATYYGKPTRHELVRCGSYSETVGAITSSGGVAFTPGTSNAEGSWTSLGTTAKDLWHFNLCVQCSNGTTTSLGYAFDLAVGDGSNKHLIIENQYASFPGTAEKHIQWINPFEGYWHVPASSTLYVRGTCSGTPASGWTAVAVGIGG